MNLPKHGSSKSKKIINLIKQITNEIKNLNK